MQIRKTCFTRCGIWRTTIHTSGSRPARNRPTINFRWQIQIREDAPDLAGGAPALQWISPDREWLKRCRASASLAHLVNSIRDMAEQPSEDRTDDLTVAWIDVVRFIRQLSHDLRNHLNAIELQSAYISELGREDELKSEIKRLREMISGLTSALQSISKAVSGVKPNLIPYRAADLVEDLRKKIDHDFSGQSAAITWNIQVGDAMLNVDPQLLQEAFTELFANAFRHDRDRGALAAVAKMDKNRLLFTLQEPKSRFDLLTESWAREPIRKVSQGHYGLGLNRVRAIVEAHGGEIYAEYNPNASALTTTLVLPGSGNENA